jgi:hypothetical protein
MQFKSAKDLRAHYDSISSKFFPAQQVGYCRRVMIITAPEPAALVVKEPSGPAVITILNPPPPPIKPSNQTTVSMRKRSIDVRGQYTIIKELYTHFAAMAQRPTVREIQKAVARIYEVQILDMLSRQRHVHIVNARHTAMALCRHLTTRSFPEIGRLFGGRDHSTVIHACVKYQTIFDRILPAPATEAEIGQALAVCA